MDRWPRHRRLSPGLRQSWRRAVGVLALGLILGALVPEITVGQGKPFHLDGLDGSSLDASDLDRGVVIAVVWATWSPHSRNVVEQVNAIADRWGKQAKVVMIDFQEDRSEVEAFLANKRPKVPVYLDQEGSFSKKYSVTNLPGLVIFKDGTAAFSGKLSRDPDSIIAQTLG